MVQLYIKHTDNNYYLLDLEESESINYKLTVKDLNDITKIFSPFTQSFNIKATDKNKILCGFVGNEKILRANNTGEFDSMIYISGFLSYSYRVPRCKNKKPQTLFHSNLQTFIAQCLPNQDIEVCYTNRDIVYHSLSPAFCG